MINELLESTSTKLLTILYIIASLKVSLLSLSDVQFNLFNIADTLEYIKKLLHTNLAPFLCIYSFYFLNIIKCIRWLNNTCVQAYSRIGLTNVKWHLSLTLDGHCFRYNLNKSNNITSTWDPLFRASAKSFTVRTSWVSQDLCCLNPCCSWHSMLCLFKWL